MKHQLKAPSNCGNFAIYTKIGVNESNVDVRIFFLKPPKYTLMRMRSGKKLEVATNAAKSPKYQSLNAKFRTLLLTITVVDFETYS